MPPAAAERSPNLENDQFEIGAKGVAEDLTLATPVKRSDLICLVCLSTSL